MRKYRAHVHAHACDMWMCAQYPECWSGRNETQHNHDLLARQLEAESILETLHR